LTCNVRFKIRFEYNLNDSEEIFNETGNKVMAEKKSLMEKAMAAAKKVIAKPSAKKTTTPKKTVAKKVIAKPSAKKTTTPKKTVAKKVAPIKKVTPSELKQFKSYIPKKNEKYMSKAQLKHFVKILNDWKIELSHDIDRTVSHMQDEVTSYADPNDRASQESDMALELRNRDRERKLIKKINDTLRLIENDDYGYCMQCGEEIGLNRLQARPTATLCIDCKTLDEIREKQMAK
jgi:DnaK suppressor protein